MTVDLHGRAGSDHQNQQKKPIAIGDDMKTIFSKSTLGVFISAVLIAMPSANAAAANETLRVGYLKVGNFTPMFLVPDEMKKCNVDAVMTEFVRYADARTGLLSNSVDVANISPADILISLAQGSDQIIGLAGNASSVKYLVVKKGVEINDWSDIKGKRIGIAPGSAVWFQWAATLAEKGIPYDTFTAVNIQGGGTAFIQALKRGDVDAVATWEPFESQLVGEGEAYFAKNVRYDQSKSVGNELGALAARRDALEKKRAAVTCFLTAYRKSEAAMIKDPDMYAASYSKFTGLPLSITGPSSKVMRLGGTLTLEQLQREASEFHKLGVIQKDVSQQVHQVWDPSIYEKIKAEHN
jgi:sulfonate transport system substrate-binding protein